MFQVGEDLSPRRLEASVYDYLSEVIGKADFWAMKDCVDNNAIKPANCDKLLIIAIESLLIRHIDIMVSKARLQIVKKLLTLNANPNQFYKGNPLLAHVIKSFIDARIERYNDSNKIVKLVKWLIKSGANTSIKYKDNYDKSMTITAYVNKWYALVWKYEEPWVKALKKIADILARKGLENFKSYPRNLSASN